jgi:hypothetical protein
MTVEQLELMQDQVLGSSKYLDHNAAEAIGVIEIALQVKRFNVLLQELVDMARAEQEAG